MYIYIYIYIYVMMKPPFKASDSAINVLSSPWFDKCTVWFVASHVHLCNIRLITSGLVIINLI